MGGLWERKLPQGKLPFVGGRKRQLASDDEAMTARPPKGSLAVGIHSQSPNSFTGRFDSCKRLPRFFPQLQIEHLDEEREAHRKVNIPLLNMLIPSFCD